MSLNVDKTKCVYFRKTKYNIGSKISKISDIASNNGPLINNDTIPIYINNKLIQLSNSVNFLGVVLNNCLGFKDHITNVLHKISRNAGLINKLKYSLLPENLITLYHSIIFPYLKYCNIVWATNATQTELDSLFKVQKKCLRIATNSHYLAPSASLFKKLSLLNIYDINKQEIATFMYKYKNKLLPAPFSDLFQYNSQIHNYNTRLSNKFHLWSVKSSYEAKSMSYLGPKQWNMIPQVITKSQFISSFRKQYKILLLNNY